MLLFIVIIIVICIIDEISIKAATKREKYNSDIRVSQLNDHLREMEKLRNKKY